MWTDDKKRDVIQAYKDANPTAATSGEIVKELAEKFEESPNGVRMVLNSAGVYIKIEAPGKGATTTSTGKAASDTKVPRVSKEAQQKALIAEIERVGGAVDTDIIDKLTGKAAVYFVEILKKLN